LGPEVWLSVLAVLVEWLFVGVEWLFVLVKLWGRRQQCTVVDGEPRRDPLRRNLVRDRPDRRGMRAVAILPRQRIPPSEI
jgi:hypothetical protein